MRAVKKKPTTKTPLLLPEKTLVRTGREEEEGVPLLLWRVEIPAFDAASDESDAASFYTEIARRAESFLCGRLTGILRSAYRDADPARRRFTFRPAVYSHTVREISRGNRLLVEREIRLLRAGRTLFARVYRESWDPADGTLLPTVRDDAENRTEKPEKAGKKKQKKVDSGAGDML